MKNLKYSGSAQALVTAGTATGGKLLYSLDKDGEYSADIPTGIDAGTYTVWYKMKSDDNHGEIAPAALEVTIGKLPVELKWNEPTEFTYDNQNHSVTAVITNLVPNDNVTLSYNGNTAANVGDYTATVALGGADAGNYTLDGVPNASLEWSIKGVDITYAAVDVNNSGLVYDGNQKRPDVTVRLNGVSLSKITDYTVTYSNNINVGTATVIITGAGNYSGSTTGYFEISPRTLTVSGAILGPKSYDGTTAGTVQSVGFDGVPAAHAALVPGDDYSAAVEYDDPNAGSRKTATVTVTLNNKNFTFANGEKTATYQLEKQVITQAETPPTPASGTLYVKNNLKKTYIYDLSALLPALDSGKTLGAVGYSINGETLPDEYYSAGATIHDNILSLTIQEVDTIEETCIGTIEVTIFSTNYANMTATITVNSTNQLLPAVTAEDCERDYNGKAVTPEELTLSAQFQGDNVPGSWTFKQAAPVNAGNHMATLIFTPDDQEIFGTVETIARVTIRQRNAVVGLQLDPGNRIYVGDDLPKAVLTFSGVLDGESIAADSFTLVGMPSDSSVAREYAISLSEDSQQAIRDRASNYNITFTGACLSILSKGTEVPPSQDEENNRLEKTELTEVPEALKEAGFNTVEQIKETMYAAAVKKLPGVTLENTIFWDITLLYSEDGGKTWIEATAENFPANGITVTLPYPDGTNATDYDFVVTHMLTQAINGMEPGQVETPAVTKTGNGLQFTVNSLSPVAVSWKAVSKNDDGVTEGGTTVSDTAPAVPQTGDTSTPALWVELLILSGLSLGGLTLFRRKNGKNNPA